MVISMQSPAQEATQRAAYLNLLRKVLHEQQEWVKVHAAEYLLWAGYSENVKEVFINEEKRFGTQSQYRIGIWRVLAQSADNEFEKSVWLNKIMAAFTDVNGPDRIHAAETLAKLGVSPLSSAPEVTRLAVESPETALALYTRWSTAYNSVADREMVKMDLIKNLTLLDSANAAVKGISAFALCQLGDLNNEEWKRVSEAALKEPEGSPARINMLSMAFVTAGEGNAGLKSEIHRQLLEYHSGKTKGERSEMAMALAKKGSPEDVTVLTEMFENKEPLGDAAADYDVMAAAAYAILKIERRKS